MKGDQLNIQLSMYALDIFYLLNYLFTHNLSVSLFLSLMFSVSCLLPCFPNSICSHIYVKKINFEGFQEPIIDLIK